MPQKEKDGKLFPLPGNREECLRMLLSSFIDIWPSSSVVEQPTDSRKDTGSIPDFATNIKIGIMSDELTISLCKNCKHSITTTPPEGTIGTGIKTNTGMDQGWLGKTFHCAKMTGYLLMSITDTEGNLIADVAECVHHEEKPEGDE